MIRIGNSQSLFSATLSGPLFAAGTTDRARFAMVKAVERGSLHLENAIRSKLKGNEREFGIFTGGLFSAIQRQAATVRGDLIESIVTPGTKKHAIVINDGRGANKRPPPVKAIELWLQKKLKFSSMAERALKSVAFMIARAIGKRGFAPPFTGGLHYMETGTAEAGPRVQHELEVGRDEYVRIWNFDNAGGLA